MKRPVETTTPQSADAQAAPTRGQSAQAQRDKRSKAALKANMARRKAQIKARGDQDTGQTTPETGQ